MQTIFLIFLYTHLQNLGFPMKVFHLTALIDIFQTNLKWFRRICSDATFDVFFFLRMREGEMMSNWLAFMPRGDNIHLSWGVLNWLKCSWVINCESSMFPSSNQFVISSDPLWNELINIIRKDGSMNGISWEKRRAYRGKKMKWLNHCTFIFPTA